MTKAVTAVICTYNRSRNLREALASIDRIYGGFPCEVIVVDNNSTDDTAAIVEAYAINGVRYIFEPTAGLSIARNTALAQTNSEIVVYIDDDVQVRPGWLENLTEPFSDPGVAVVGGELVPVWSIPRPAWLTDAWVRNYSVELKWSTFAREIRTGEWLCEGNIAFRRSALIAAGGFPVNLGRVGPVLLSGEGVVIEAIQAAGGGAVFSPGSIVDHLIPEDRITPKWLLARLFWQGVTMSAVNRYRVNTLRDNYVLQQWDDLRLPTSHKRWELLLNGQADHQFADLLHEVAHMGYALHSAGLIQV